MAANREDDRREAARTPAQAPQQSQQAANAGAKGNLRAQVYARLARIRQGQVASPGAGHGIDREFDYHVSVNATHTKGSGAEAQNRMDIEVHRSEAQQAAIDGAVRQRAQAHDRADRTWDVGKAAKLHARAETRFRRETGGRAGLEDAGVTKKRKLTPRQAMARTTRRAAEAGVDISHRKLDVGPNKKKARARPNAGRAFARPGRLEFGGGRAAPPPVRPGPRSAREMQRDRDMARAESAARAR